MLKDKAYKYFIETDHNCAESALLAINEEYGLDLRPDDFHLVSAFGGGMGCGKLCGVLAGCMAACGKMNVTDRAHATAGFGDLCAALYQAFETRLGSTVCAELKPMYRNDTVRCLKTVELGLEVFEEFAKEKGFAPQAD
jgi:C_GCAxxG_C_C family probable redox protein